MIAYSSWQLPTYQVLGPVIRVHWGYGTREVQETDGEETRTEHYATEAVVPRGANQAEFVRIVEDLGGPAEELAQGWFGS